MFYLDWRWSYEDTVGNVPPGRRGHTAVYIERPKSLILYGGLILLNYLKKNLKIICRGLWI